MSEKKTVHATPSILFRDVVQPPHPAFRQSEKLLFTKEPFSYSPVCAAQQGYFYIGIHNFTTRPKRTEFKQHEVGPTDTAD